MRCETRRVYMWCEMRLVYMFFDGQHVDNQHLAWAIAENGELLTSCRVAQRDRVLATQELRHRMALAQMRVRSEWVDEPLSHPGVDMALAANYIRWAA